MNFTNVMSSRQEKTIKTESDPILHAWINKVGFTSNQELILLVSCTLMVLQSALFLENKSTIFCLHLQLKILRLSKIGSNLNSLCIFALKILQKQLFLRLVELTGLADPQLKKRVHRMKTEKGQNGKNIKKIRKQR